MIKRLLFFITLSAISCTVVAAPSPDSDTRSSASANIQYVTDHIVIVLRAGPSNKHKVLRSLSSGTRLQVLATDGEFSKVRTDANQEGWALSRHLSKQPIAKHRLEPIEKNLAALKKENTSMKQQIKELTEENERLKQNQSTLTEEKAQLDTELSQLRDLAAKPLELSSANENLTMQAVSLENKVELMKQEIQVLRNDSEKQWFLTGGGVVLLGVFIGMIIPKMRRHRRSDWSSLS